MQRRLTSVGKFLLASLAQLGPMNTHPHTSVMHRIDPRSLTAGTIVRGAQIALLAIGGWAMPGYFSGSITDEQAARVALALDPAAWIDRLLGHYRARLEHAALTGDEAQRPRPSIAAFAGEA